MKTYKQSMNTIVSSHIFPYKECIFTQYAHCTETSCAWQQCEEACPQTLQPVQCTVKRVKACIKALTLS